MELADQGRIASLVRRIKHCKSVELWKAVDEVLKMDDPIPDELIATITSRVHDGAIMSNSSLASLVARSKSAKLYRAARGAIVADLWSVVAAYRAGIEDPDLEVLLCNWLFHYATESQDPVRRRYIVEALRDCGSLGCLQALEGLTYDFSATAGVAGVVEELEKATGGLSSETDVASRIASLNREVDLDFGKLLREAAAAVKRRGKQVDAGAQRVSISDPFVGAREHRAAALRQISQGDYGAALNYTRKSLESLLKAVIRTLNLSLRSADPVDGLLLPVLLSAINEHLEVPSEYRKALESVRDDSTLGSHDQGKAKQELITQAVSQAAVDRCGSIEKFFDEVLKDPAKFKKIKHVKREG